MRLKLWHGGVPYYERKFITDDFSVREIEALVKTHPAVFREIFHERYINNIYFDTIDMESYFDATEGSMHRFKIRIRWYGDMLGDIAKPMLEMKIKNGFLLVKHLFPLPGFTMRRGIGIADIQALLQASAIPASMKLNCLNLHSFLLNRYRRRYFRSADHQYRVTIDSEVESRRLNDRSNSFLNGAIDRQTIIVEIKYGLKHEEGAAQVSEHFPFRMTRSSKYTNGIESVVYV